MKSIQRSPLSLAMLVSFLIPSISIAQTNKWTINEYKEYISASVFNDDGELFAQRCSFDGQCSYVIATDTQCADSGQSPGLVSSEKGGDSIKFICDGSYIVGGVNIYRYMISSFDSINEIIDGSGTVGFAMPLVSGKFKVMRFTINGAKAAIDSMRYRASSAKKSNTKGTTL